MILLTYKDYNEYVYYQTNGNKADPNSQWGKRDEIQFLSDYLKNNFKTIKNGLCHGCKQGNEQKWFSEFTGANVIGTEISDAATQYPNTIQWDFHNVKEEWVKKIDFIYSNSFDHSYDPMTCLKRWMSCLTDGCCILEWSVGHTKEFTSMIDPFGATDEEYRRLIIDCGFYIKDILHYKSPNFIHPKTYYIIVHKPKLDQSIEFNILCDGGLGNRLGALIGGLAIAEDVGGRPIICWPENNWCGCAFNDLFNTDLNVISVDINTLFNSKIDHVFMMHENQTGIILQTPYIAPTFEGLDILRQTKTGIVYYNNSVPLFIDRQRVDEVICGLKIKNDIVSRVNVFCEHHNVSRETIGIHLRKTDFGNQINEDMVLKYIQGNPQTIFFVCSDDYATETKFKNNSNVIIFDKKFYPEKLVEGSWNKNIVDKEGRTFPFNINRPRVSVIEAFIDMLILSKTTQNFNTNSSFSWFAKIYGRNQNAIKK